MFTEHAAAYLYIPDGLAGEVAKYGVRSGLSGELVGTPPPIDVLRHSVWSDDVQRQRLGSQSDLGAQGGVFEAWGQSPSPRSKGRRGSPQRLRWSVNPAAGAARIAPLERQLERYVTPLQPVRLVKSPNIMCRKPRSQLLRAFALLKAHVSSRRQTSIAAATRRRRRSRGHEVNKYQASMACASAAWRPRSSPVWPPTTERAKVGCILTAALLSRRGTAQQQLPQGEDARAGLCAGLVG